MNSAALYHGSHDPALSSILGFMPTAEVDFGGLFFSADRQSAESHGAHVYECAVDCDEIADSSELRRRGDEIVALGLTDNEDEIDAAIDDSGDSWDCQILRGQIARRLGFRAVEMSDEHGTSYLVFAGTDIAATD